jgi:hypothetical protein
MLTIANKRVEQLKANGFANAMVYDPPGVGGTGVVTVVAHGDMLDAYRLPSDPTVPVAVWLWKKALRWMGSLGMLMGVGIATLHYLRFGPKHAPGSRDSQ